MAESVVLDGIPPEELEQFLAFSARVQGTNISPQTLLATDYLNHFNEIIMLIGMIADIPECFEEAMAWLPKTYQEHFQDSQFRDKDLAIEAYNHVPTPFKKPFEDIIRQMNVMVVIALAQIGEVTDKNELDHLPHLCTEASYGIQHLMDLASAVIHGSQKVLDQGEIDGMLLDFTASVEVNL